MKKGRRELMNGVRNMITRTTKLHAHQLTKRNSIARTIDLRKIRTDHTLITAKQRPQIQAPPKPNKNGYTPTLELLCCRSGSNYNNFNSNFHRYTTLRKWKKNIVTLYLQSTDEHHNSLHNHNQPVSAPIIHESLLTSHELPKQCNENIVYFVREYEERIEASITFLENATTGNKDDTYTLVNVTVSITKSNAINGNIKYFEQFSYDPEREPIPTSKGDRVKNSYGEQANKTTVMSTPNINTLPLPYRKEPTEKGQHRDNDNVDHPLPVTTILVQLQWM